MLKNLKRKFFKILWSVSRYTPECFGAIRGLCVKGYIEKCGKSVSIGRLAKIHKSLKLGEHSGIGYRCVINSSVTIGDNVMMGPEVITFSSNHSFDRTDIPMNQQGFSETKPIVIEDDVWIGARVCILPGVTIGKGSVIGACAVVSKDIPPYSVAVGNPIKIIKNRKDN